MLAFLKKIFKKTDSPKTLSSEDLAQIMSEYLKIYKGRLAVQSHLGVKKVTKSSYSADEVKMLEGETFSLGATTMMEKFMGKLGLLEQLRTAEREVFKKFQEESPNYLKERSDFVLKQPKDSVLK